MGPRGSRGRSSLMTGGHTHIHTYTGHTHTYIYWTHIHTYIHTYTGHTHTYIYWTHTHTYTGHTHTNEHCTHIHTYIHCTHIHTHTYIHWTHTHTHCVFLPNQPDNLLELGVVLQSSPAPHVPPSPHPLGVHTVSTGTEEAVRQDEG